ncbi:MAG TPA: DUF305 domain-containing protein [Nocardioidaceae bacterium]|nr:DUF305 domain-containing protein [Nocardioidaceae bacterium]
MTEFTTSRRTYVLASAIIAIAVAAAVGLVAGYQIGKDPAQAGQTVPADDSVDAGFARDMQVHHAQAVEMSYIVRDNTSDQDVRLLAYDIATTQQGQIGYMTAWLDMWDLPQHSSDPAMAWMSDDMTGHDMGHMSDDQMLGDDGLMPGMATPEQMEQLRQARGKQAAILYLQLMIRHHMGGVEMAQYAVEHAEVDDVRHLAQTMETAQTYEIDAMNDMLAERGAQPIK